MIQTLIGQKMDQMQNFRQDGQRIPVTEILVADNVVLHVKTMEKDAYSAAQIGTGIKNKATKSQVGYAKKAGLKNAVLKTKEVALGDISEDDMPKTGDNVSVDVVFKPGDIVQITGTSKGKGFAGVVRRYNFRGGPKTHGQSDRHRAPGSIGQTTTPGRVYKGKRMGGRMGSDTVTVKNLRVVDVDSENKKLYVAGLVPGHRSGWLFITKTGEDSKFIPLISDKEEVVEEIQAEEVVQMPVETVETAAETVETPEEAVETAVEAVETPVDTEVSNEPEVTEESKVEIVEEEQKAEIAEEANEAVEKVKEETENA